MYIHWEGTIMKSVGILYNPKRRKPAGNWRGFRLAEEKEVPGRPVVVVRRPVPPWTLL